MLYQEEPPACFACKPRLQPRPLHHFYYPRFTENIIQKGVSQYLKGITMGITQSTVYLSCKTLQKYVFNRPGSRTRMNWSQPLHCERHEPKSKLCAKSRCRMNDQLVSESVGFGCMQYRVCFVITNRVIFQLRMKLRMLFSI